MIRSLVLLAGFLSSYALGVENNTSDPTELYESCRTHTVINESENTTSTITRCQHKTVADLPKQQEKPHTVNEPNDSLELHGYPFNIFDDLDTQKSIAESTDVITGYTRTGLVISVLGLIAIFFTIQQNRIALKHVQSTSTLELKPYISARVASVTPFQDWDGESRSQSFELRLIISNAGKTPASSILATLDGTRFSFMREGERNSADFQGLSGQLVATEFHVGQDDQVQMIFIGSWTVNDRSAWAWDQENIVTGESSNWVCTNVEIPTAFIRYKDLECQLSRRHRIIEARVWNTSLNGAENVPSTAGFRIRRIGWENDNRHEHYNRNPAR